ncbi:class I SAM-dependent methyltransferase [Streptosporangium lutulentum]|uniref:SAM-dependent methyltransferase n=1 Tax=Streptosporangium lutulentum TaxID=1461250 RepID=A0ABT9Q8F4_9ACTN|nr:class I SAM-dependent methyltransferase [Streptosporangium lutulentum]MDP9842947.1 SAM-dependent methyltransferase [Streptosporangium lutulentum]
MFSDAEAAALYDVMNPWDPARYPEVVFCTELVMAAGAVLDLGCGTGSMLHRARDLGHTGRLVGLDPDHGMLDRAKRRTDIAWVSGVAADAAWDDEFDLATMTSNAFQHLVTDDELRASLTAIRTSLRDGGRFVFGTRHPQARAWESWNPSNAFDIEGATGRKLRMWHDVESVAGDVVTFTETTAERDGTVLRVDRASLRFLDVPALATFLTGAGFTIEDQYGDWHRGPITETSREIVTIARRVRTQHSAPDGNTPHLQ